MKISDHRVSSTDLVLGAFSENVCPSERWPITSQIRSGVMVVMFERKGFSAQIGLVFWLDYLVSTTHSCPGTTRLGTTKDNVWPPTFRKVGTPVETKNICITI